ncbi:MAG: hypothetical protein V7L20_20035 [Nostoc sp.]|uniref:hypothetical protein n=1 Tax=Nostoc sp. TaxID=1180 RepID=UPI002FF4581A
MKTIADVAPMTWWQKFRAWVIAFEEAMDFRETDILSDRIESLERRIADLEAQFHDSNDCISSSINPIIESEAHETL